MSTLNNPGDFTGFPIVSPCPTCGTCPTCGRHSYPPPQYFPPQITWFSPDSSGSSTSPPYGPKEGLGPIQC